MWISIFAASFAIALILCVAAIMIQSESNTAEREDALVARRSEVPPPAGCPSPRLSAHEYAETGNVPRPVSSSLAEHLRSHYRPVLSEPLPAHLIALVDRL
jgi:hypothetical protein